MPDIIEYENVFPITTVDITDDDKIETVQIIYIFFDHPSDDCFADNEDVDHYSFKINSSGQYNLTFATKAFDLSDSYKEYLFESKIKYQHFLVNRSEHLEFNLDKESRPEWWQDDETPFNSKGHPMTFVCQLDMADIIGDDCRLFVFYDKADRKVTNIYQRT